MVICDWVSNGDWDVVEIFVCSTADSFLDLLHLKMAWHMILCAHQHYN